MMITEKRKLSELISDPNNIRKHNDKNIEAIKGSLAKFGQQKPIVIDEKNIIIAGNGTFEAAKALKWPHLDVVVTTLTGYEKTAFALADNRTAELAEWSEGLDKALAELSKEIDMTAFGFDFEVKDEAKDAIENEIPEVEQNIHGVKLGDIYQLGNHRLMCGDSTSKEQVERLMNGEKADMVFTDPPYGVDYKGINNDTREGLENLIDQAFANASLFSENGAACYVFHSDRCADIFHAVYRKHCHFSSMLIWVKPAFVLSQTDYQSQHEPCLYGWFNTGRHRWNGDRKQTSILNYGKESVDGHTTPKPVELIISCVSNSSKKGDSCLDPFLGSGSTLIACEKTNRKCYGMEIDPHYCSVIIERWQKYSDKIAVKL